MGIRYFFLCYNSQVSANVELERGNEIKRAKLN